MNGRVAAAVLLAAAAAVLVAPAEAAGGGGGRRRALLVGLGGARADVVHRAVWSAGRAPVLQRLMSEGTWAACASPGDPTCAAAHAGNRHGSRPPAVPEQGLYASEFGWTAAPGWCSVVTGVDNALHGVRGDSPAEMAAFAASAARFPSVFARARAAGLRTAASGGPGLLSAPAAGPGGACLPGVLDYECGGAAAGAAACGAASSCTLDVREGQTPDGAQDNRTAAFGARRAAEGDADLVMLQFDGVARAGAASGANSSEAAAAVEAVDALLGAVMNAVDAAAARRGEEWLVVVTADRGGLGLTHGSNWIYDEAVPFVVATVGRPAGAPPQRELAAPARHFDAAPTVLSHLGVALRPGDAPLSGAAQLVAPLAAAAPVPACRACDDNGSAEDNGRARFEARTLILSVLGALLVGLVIGAVGARAAAGGRKTSDAGDDGGAALLESVVR